MASDEIVWSVIGHQFCSFKLKTSKNQTFCREPHNVTGLCNRQSCPLANSRYATIRANPDTGTLYLYMKTIERSHMPSKWWERIRLSSSYAKALEQVDERLIYWPKFLVHKCKQRLTRLTQVAIRMKRLAKEEERLGEQLVPKLAPKVRRREETRERKAMAAAKVERAIERELIERLRSGAYGTQPLNVDEAIWKKVLRGLEQGGEGQRDKDLDEGVVEEEEEFEHERELEGDGIGEVEYVSDIEGESDTDIDDLEDWLGDESEEDGDEDEDVDGDSEDDSEDNEEETTRLKKALAGAKRKRPAAPSSKPKKKGAKGPKTEIEYEIEKEPVPRQVAYA
ncbi:Mak16 protein [Patellaria atrata CBS 101060]|uniref:Protein MAK16 n=1 Tax=Patellaria atrata CBS 101060 TaxID=1346257 RepID=A0A9P4VNY4_9PEZI|nr:Mak16 protein [Patellaria atrata CBS 101060]